MKFQPAKDYDSLLKQARALHQLLNSKESQLSIYRNKDDQHSVHRLKQLELSLESEKDMNDLLTNENIALQASIDELKQTGKL